mmetsp:Transcript_21206/g.47094  ORF Transcript_21206/g.47094 Transcript_21206/m.47094 type:complete len:106 (-) Transcript_21206:89-406(-)|eukprot:CAMPEP_0173203322 /NCGR_PEP_ID=MMETSP1141-20130122/19455_1 /TAXON_ID=483371 /ORGANISM="non described non described, Strain CCMP2298" /LENGTH=105 /DNA_ID=CAMNT_0014128767 /DNA_START=75 /DNA_END=392 /DNA_ORIENTATION=-
MGAAASIKPENFADIKTSYEAKKKEEGITDEALFEYMKGIIEAKGGSMDGEAPAAEAAAEAPAEAVPAPTEEKEAPADAVAVPAEVEAVAADAEAAPAEVEAVPA